LAAAIGPCGSKIFIAEPDPLTKTRYEYSTIRSVQ
jgi:hypothetical protein